MLLKHQVKGLKKCEDMVLCW